MQILTPTGYKDASELQVGDEVVALDIVTGMSFENTVLEIKQFTTEDWLQLHNYQDVPFTYILINGTYSFFKDQSIWVNGNIKHVSELEVGDIIYSEYDVDITVTSVEEVNGLDYWWRLEISGDHSYIADGVQLHNASRFWVGGTGTWDASDTSHWSATTGGASGASVPGASDTATFDGSSGGGTATVNTNISITTLTTSAFTGTLDFSANNNTVTLSAFVNTGTATRTINCGSGQWTLTGNNTSIWSMADLTNCTFTPPASAIDCTYSGSTGTRTFTHGSTAGATEANVPSVDVTAGTDIFSNSGGGLAAFKDIDFTGFSGSWTNNGRMIYGSLVVSATMTLTAGNTVQTFNATSGTKSITSNGVTMDFPITINGVGGTFQPVGTLTMGSTRTLTIAGGSWNDNGQTVSVGIFNSNGTTTRAVTISGTLNVTGNSATVWNCNNMTNLTFTQTGTINLTYSGGTGTRTITNATVANNGIQSANISLNITAGTDTIGVSNARTCGSIDFTGFAGSWTPTTATYYGNLILNSTMVVNDNGTINLTFAPTSGTYTISSNGNTTFGQGGTNIIINGVGGSYQWGSDFYSLGSVTLSNGNLNFNNYNTTCLTFASTNNNVRTLTLGSGTATLTGTGTVWDTSNTVNLTFDAGTSTITMNNASSSSKTFAGGALTFNNIRMTGAGTGTFIMGTSTTAMTLNNWTVDTAPHTVQVYAGKTITATSVTWSGTAGNLNTFQSTTNGTPWSISIASGDVTADYISLQDSTATGGAQFFAGINSTDVSGNTNWIFSVPFTVKGISSITGISTLTF